MGVKYHSLAVNKDADDAPGDLRRAEFDGDSDAVHRSIASASVDERVE